MAADKPAKKELADLDAKVVDARKAVRHGASTAKDEADLKILEQEAIGKKLEAKHPPKEAKGGSSVDDRLDDALKDSFPTSDPVSIVEAAPPDLKKTKH